SVAPKPESLHQRASEVAAMSDALDPLTAAAAFAEADDEDTSQHQKLNGDGPAAVLPASPELTLAGSRRFGDDNSLMTSFEEGGGDEDEDKGEDSGEGESDASVTEIVAKSTVRPQPRSPLPPPPPPPQQQQQQQNQPASSAAAAASKQESNDLFVTVDDPIKKVTTMEAFVLYRVSSNGTRPELGDRVHSVRRRFTDFSRLRMALAEAWPGRVLPPLPEKHPLATIDRFDSRFVGRRARALQRFLGRLADNPVLSAAPVFLAFLTAPDSQEFERQCKQLQQPQASLLPQLLLSKSRRAAQSSALRPEFVAADRVAAGAGRLFGRFEKAADRLAGELRGLAAEEAALAEALYSLQLAEKAWAADSGCDSAAVEDLRRAAKAASDGVRAAEDLAEFASEEVGQPMHEYLLYTGCVRDCLTRASGLQAQAQAAQDSLEKARTAEQQQPTQPSSSAAASAERIAELSSRSNRLSDIASAACADLTADLDRWRLDRIRDTRTLLHGLAAAHTDRLTTTAEAWAAAAATANESAGSNSPSLAARRQRPQLQRMDDREGDSDDD
ncbi:hypothetical protein BOX15_Mlig031763g1, partial [Macrostomum lignano]